MCKGVHYWANIHLWGREKTKQKKTLQPFFLYAKYRGPTTETKMARSAPEIESQQQIQHSQSICFYIKWYVIPECTLIRLTTHDYPVQHHRDFNAHLSIKDYFTAEKYNHSSSL